MRPQTHMPPAQHPRDNLQLIGFGAIEKQLRKLADTNTMPSGIIFSGLKGCGKATLAYRLARFLLNNRPQDALLDEAAPPPAMGLHTSPESHINAKISARSHPDLFVLEGDSISIDEVRSMSLFLQQTAFYGGYKIVLLDYGDNLNAFARGALLKTLEEPAGRSVIILLSENLNLMHPTILSRCSKFIMPTLDCRDIKKILRLNDPNKAPIANLDEMLPFTGPSPGRIETFLAHDFSKMRQLLEAFILRSILDRDDRILYPTLKFLGEDKEKTKLWLDMLTSYISLIIRFNSGHLTPCSESERKIWNITKDKLSLWAEYWNDIICFTEDSKTLNLGLKNLLQGVIYILRGQGIHNVYR